MLQGISQARPTHSLQHSSHCSLPCPMPSWQLLCPPEREAWPSTRHTPTAAINTHWGAVNTAWAETRERGRCSALLTQLIVNNSMSSDTLAKHSPTNRENYAVIPSILIKGFEKQVLRLLENHPFIFATPFSVDVKTLPVNFQRQCVEWQSDIQLNDAIMPLY